jgi:hypothetical protein
MNANLEKSEQHRGVPSLRGDAPRLLPLRQRLALSALVTGVSVWIRVAELTDARRD